ncbi:MAG: DUF6906 family protein [Oscillospiraceae bacterium]
MKHGKNPTRRQKQDIASLRLNPDNWLVCKDTPEELVIEHRISGKVKVIRKEILK